VSSTSCCLQNTLQSARLPVRIHELLGCGVQQARCEYWSWALQTQNSAAQLPTTPVLLGTPPQFPVPASPRAACFPCNAVCSRPGYYSTSAVDSCTACEQHKYQPASGQISCINCPVGYETTNTANTECTPCSAGYYKNVEGIACIAAPAGTYVNTTAATTYTPW